VAGLRAPPRLHNMIDGDPSRVATHAYRGFVRQCRTVIVVLTVWFVLLVPLRSLFLIQKNHVSAGGVVVHKVPSLLTLYLESTTS